MIAISKLYRVPLNVLLTCTSLSLAIIVSITLTLVRKSNKRRNSNDKSKKGSINGQRKDVTRVSSAYSKLIGNTPLIELQKLSKLTGCRIYAKMECNNPGGTGKDRAVRYMMQKLQEREGGLPSGTVIVEGTSGSTGIALAMLCNALRCKLHIVMPDDQSEEKRQLLERLSAEVTVVPCCSIANKGHYVNRAKLIAAAVGGVFMNQFENLHNFMAHYEETGPEIWTQTEGVIDAFVMSSGTGGTIAGVSNYLKEKRSDIKVILADPQGSSLHSRINHGVCFTAEQSERTIRKSRYDSIVEGIGLDRVTKNFEAAKVDWAECITDQEALDVAHWLLREEGLFVGSSSAVNIAATCLVAKKLGPGHSIVTVICDNGQRHLSRFWNPNYIESYELCWPERGVIPSCLSVFFE